MKAQHYGQQLKGILVAWDLQASQVASELGWDDAVLSRLLTEEIPDPMKCVKVGMAIERLKRKPHLQGAMA